MRASSIVSAALLVLLGAVVGAVGSAGGSVIVNRREVVRTARIRMYRELVGPMLAEAIGSDKDRNWDETLVETLYRESALAGHRDRVLVDVVLEAWLEQADISEKHGGRTAYGDPIKMEPEILAEWNKSNEVLIGGLRALESHLRRKIR